MTEGLQPDLIMFKPLTQWLGWDGDTVSAKTHNKTCPHLRRLLPPFPSPKLGSFSCRPTGQPVGGFDRGLMTILRRADTESAGRATACGQIRRCSTHRVQMKRSGSASGRGGGSLHTEAGRVRGPHCHTEAKTINLSSLLNATWTRSFFVCFFFIEHTNNIWIVKDDFNRWFVCSRGTSFRQKCLFLIILCKTLTFRSCEIPK